MLTEAYFDLKTQPMDVEFLFVFHCFIFFPSPPSSMEPSRQLVPTEGGRAAAPEHDSTADGVSRTVAAGGRRLLARKLNKETNKHIN